MRRRIVLTVYGLVPFIVSFHDLKLVTKSLPDLEGAVSVPAAIGHTGTASLQTRCAKPSEWGRIREDTRSTLLPSSFSYADDIAHSLRQLYSPGIHFTRKSTSLSGRSSLRAHEPKTQSFSALCLFAIAYISSRFARISSNMHICEHEHYTKIPGYLLYNILKSSSGVMIMGH